MTSARAIILSGLLVALAVIGSAWWIVRSAPPPTRYQIVNVGKGETQRIDLQTGTITRCVYGRCEALTKGAAVIDKPDDWPGVDAPGMKATPGS